MAAQAVWVCVALCLLLRASLSMLAVISPSLRMEAADAGRLFRAVILFTLLFELGVRWISGRIADALGELSEMTGRGGRLLGGIHFLFPGISALLTVLGGLQFFHTRREELSDGFQSALYHYIPSFNRYFKANIVVPEGEETFLSAALLFLFLMLFLLLFHLAFLMEKWWPFLFLPAVPMALGMYVGLAPGYVPLAMTAVGLFMLYRRGRGSGWLRGALAGVGLLSLILFLSGMLFVDRAAGMLSFSAGAKQLETKIERKVQSVFSGAFLAGREKVVNASPRYRDARIMTVRLDGEPKGNLYFKEFHGGDYRLGNWSSEEGAFLSACRKNGTKQEQAAFYLATSVYSFEEMERIRYELRYNGFLSQAMLLPYAVNAAGIKGMDCKGDFVARKSTLQRSLSFEGLSSNTFTEGVVRRAEGRGCPEEERAFWNWYDDFVEENYLDVPDFVTGTKAYSEIYLLIQGSSFFDSSSVSSDGKDSNSSRLSKASRVAGFLGEHYSYDWELDAIGGGVDPVRYFLEEGHKGYCMHFASAGVLLLRSVGVPARYASGYAMKPSAFEKQENGTYLAQVIDRNAHAWTEIYLDGIGWIPVEMTPGYDSRLTALPTSAEAQREREQKKASRESREQSEENSEEPETSSEPEETSEPYKESEAEETEESSEEPDEETAENSEEKSDPIESESPSGENESSSEKKTGGFWSPGPGDGGALRQLAGFLGRVAIALGSLAGAVLIIWVICRVYQKRLEDLMTRKYYKAAVLLMNRRNYRKLRRRGRLKAGTATDRDYEESLLRLLGEDRREQIEEYMRIVKAAAFSRERITREECAVVLRVYQRLRTGRIPGGRFLFKAGERR